MIIFLTKANECDIIIKLSHESESQENERAKEAGARIGRLTVAGGECSRKVHLTRKRKCDRIERLTVLGSLFGERKKVSGLNFSS